MYTLNTASITTLKQQLASVLGLRTTQAKAIKARLADYNITAGDLRRRTSWAKALIEVYECEDALRRAVLEDKLQLGSIDHLEACLTATPDPVMDLERTFAASEVIILERSFAKSSRVAETRSQMAQLNAEILANQPDLQLEELLKPGLPESPEGSLTVEELVLEAGEIAKRWL